MTGFDLALFEPGMRPVEPWTDPAPACRKPFAHIPDDAETFEHRCGHQVLELPCGCTIDDHDYEECDGMAVAELEEAR